MVIGIGCRDDSHAKCTTVLVLRLKVVVVIPHSIVLAVKVHEPRWFLGVF